MLEKLTAIEAKYSQIEARLSAPETYEDTALVARLNQEQAELQPLVETFRAFQRAKEAGEQARELMADPEMKDLAQEELLQAQADCQRLEHELRLLLLPRDPNDNKSVVMEDPGRRGRRGGRPVRPLPVPHVRHVRRAQALELRGRLRQRNGAGRREGDHLSGRG